MTIAAAFCGGESRDWWGRQALERRGTGSMYANSFAYAALLLWFPVSLVLCLWLGARLGVILTLLGAQLLLPVGIGIKPPLSPDLGRGQIAVLGATVGCLLVARQTLARRRPFGGTEIFLAVMLLSTIPMALLNTDPLQFGPRYLPGLTLYDALSLVVERLLMIGLPFMLGRRLFRRAEDLRLFFVTYVVLGLIYSLPMLYEIRMSPQLHRLVYGYHPHLFTQTMRDGGFRPVVFLGHGLAVAFFTFYCVASACILVRSRVRVLGVRAGGLAAYLGILLVLCKSMASMIYGAISAPLLLLAKSRLQMRAAVLVAVLACTYPLLRAAGLFPEERMLRVSEYLSSERADSLEFRFRNEQQLLARAQERPWFGWGTWGRNRIFDQDGIDRSVSDGYWIIMLGMQGAVGYVGAFGMALAPILLASLRLRRFSPDKDRYLVSGAAIVVAFSLIDWLPNVPSMLSYFLAGALGGVAESATARVPRAARLERVPLQAPPFGAATPPAGPTPSEPTAIPGLRSWSGTSRE
jgi:hypothetical protein